MAERARETFLGLDIGTSSVKALLVDAEQRTVGEASTPLNVSRPQPLWSEQNPSDWVEGVETAVACQCGALTAPETAPHLGRFVRSECGVTVSDRKTLSFRPSRCRR